MQRLLWRCLICLARFFSVLELKPTLIKEEKVLVLVGIVKSGIQRSRLTQAKEEVCSYTKADLHCNSGMLVACFLKLPQVVHHERTLDERLFADFLKSRKKNVWKKGLVFFDSAEVKGWKILREIKEYTIERQRCVGLCMLTTALRWSYFSIWRSEFHWREVHHWKRN